MKRDRVGEKGEMIRSGWKFTLITGRLESPDGQDLLLEPRLARLLFLLMDNESQMVSRERLTAGIWPDTIVNEESLTRAVADLRRKLRENFRDAVTIDTFSRRGYQLRLNNTPRVFALRFKIKHPLRAALITIVMLSVFLLWITDQLHVVVK